MEIKQFFSVIFVVSDTQMRRHLKTAKITAKLILLVQCRDIPESSLFSRYTGVAKEIELNVEVDWGFEPMTYWRCHPQNLLFLILRTLLSYLW